MPLEMTAVHLSFPSRPQGKKEHRLTSSHSNLNVICLHYDGYFRLIAKSRKWFINYGHDSTFIVNINRLCAMSGFSALAALFVLSLFR